MQYLQEYANILACKLECQMGLGQLSNRESFNAAVFTVYLVSVVSLSTWAWRARNSCNNGKSQVQGYR